VHSKSPSCPYPHANYNFKETGDDDSQIVSIMKARVIGRRDKKWHDRSERHFEVVATRFSIRSEKAF
jgi:hypothetical protein